MRGAGEGYLDEFVAEVDKQLEVLPLLVHGLEIPFCASALQMTKLSGPRMNVVRTIDCLSAWFPSLRSVDCHIGALVRVLEGH